MPTEDTDRPTIPSLIAIAVGNTRTRLGTFEAGTLESTQVHAHEQLADAAAVARKEAKRLLDAPGPDPIVVVGSVAPARAREMADLIDPRALGIDLFHVGSDIVIDLTTSLDDDGVKSVGTDRLLNAIAAFEIAQQACVVVDIGTAITCDFVDGTGVFHGGAIAPGITTMLDALHARTEQLPALKYEPPPADRAWGSNTPDAMNLGVTGAVRGLVRWCVERDAEKFGAFPFVIATGGDAGVLEDEGIVDRFVPELQLLGIHAACARSLAHDDG